MGTVGKFDRQIEIKSPTTTITKQGAPQKTFIHLCYRWASRVPAGDSPETYQNQRLVSAVRYKYRTHLSSAINETMRIVDQNVQYNILQVLPDPESRLFIEILAEKVTE